MTIETVLDIKDVYKLWLETADIIPHCDHHMYFAGAIEQAVLKSDEVQELKKDADRWRKASESWKVFRVEIYPGAVMAHVNGIPWYTLADQADATMEK